MLNLYSPTVTSLQLASRNSTRIGTGNGIGKQVAELFFTQENNSNVYVCRCGTRRKRTGTSYQNFFSHLQTAHGSCIEKLTSGDSLSQSHLNDYFVTSKSGHLFAWIDYIMSRLLPFSFVEKAVIRKHILIKPYSLNTFMKYMTLLIELLELKIAESLHRRWLSFSMVGHVSPRTIWLFSQLTNFQTSMNIPSDYRLFLH